MQSITVLSLLILGVAILSVHMQPNEEGHGRRSPPPPPHSNVTFHMHGTFPTPMKHSDHQHTGMPPRHGNGSHGQGGHGGHGPGGPGDRQ